MNRVKLSPRRRSPSIRSDELVSYKNIVLLRRFISEHGRIFSRRVNRLTSKQQRSVGVAIKRARIPALPPFSSNEN
uniref:Small ribosomal subunit protein bS18c n=1 Tax=Schizaea pectinata TaxID=148576 RepID=A0A286QHN2_9MONI|nr:ribosomal protein S18 [Schizaea pectinata]APT66111.1 ribosomal protein S18 [Schizaea pectinata]